MMNWWRGRVRRIPEVATSQTALKVGTVVLPALFVVLLELFRRTVAEETTTTLFSTLLLLVIVLVAAFIFSRLVFAAINRLQGERIRELETLREVNEAVEEFRNLDALVNHAMGKLMEIMDVDRAELYLVDERTDDLMRMAYGGSPGAAPIWRTQSQEKRQFLQESARKAQPSVFETLEGFDEQPIASLADIEVGSLALIPLRARSSTIGVVCLLSLNPGKFRPQQANLLLSVGHTIAVAIENARLHEKVQAIAVLEERERISAELHDGLAQVLSYVITKSQATRQLLRKIAMADEYLVEVEKVAQDVYTDTREAILGLSTAISGDRSMLAALREYARRFNQMHGIKTEVIVTDRVIPTLPPRVELQAFRIVQEALSNVRKHAEATRAMITVAAGGDEVSVVVEDDGKGFRVDEVGQSNWGGFGLRNMKGRADSIGGTLGVESKLEHGTRVTLGIPLTFRQTAVKKGAEIEGPSS